LVPVATLHIEHYRSIRALTLRLGRVNTVVGANGTGKSNLYRALRLLHVAAVGRLAETFVLEGGMPSVLYAGPKRRDEIYGVRLVVGVDFETFSYRLACGVPTPRETVFRLDPEVKEEDFGVAVTGRKRPISLCERRNQVVTVRSESGERDTLVEPFNPAESILSQLIDPRRFPELAYLRMTLSDWRFYHQFRTDSEAPARQLRLGVRSPVLADDGSNLVS
jgi:predicted ATPase